MYNVDLHMKSEIRYLQMMFTDTKQIIYCE